MIEEQEVYVAPDEWAYTPPTSNERLRAELQAMVDEFLARGGHIATVQMGEVTGVEKDWSDYYSSTFGHYPGDGENAEKLGKLLPQQLPHNKLCKEMGMSINKIRRLIRTYHADSPHAKMYERVDLEVKRREHREAVFAAKRAGAKTKADIVRATGYSWSLVNYVLTRGMQHE